MRPPHCTALRASPDSSYFIRSHFQFKMAHFDLFCYGKSVSQPFPNILSELPLSPTPLKVPSNVRRQTAQSAVAISDVRLSAFPDTIALIVCLRIYCSEMCSCTEPVAVLQRGRSRSWPCLSGVGTMKASSEVPFRGACSADCHAAEQRSGCSLSNSKREVQELLFISLHEF